jgi:tetratricopeptide (TPR) repeat protein
MRRGAGLLPVLVLLGGVACRQTAESPKKIALTTSSTEAQAAYLKARDLVENLRTTEARPLLDEAIRKDPNFAMAHLLRAQTATSSSEAIEDLKAAVAAAGEATDGEQLLIRAQEAYANGDNKMRGEYLAKLVAAYPGDERAHWFLGLYHYGLQQHDAAITELQKAAQLAPGYAPAYNNLGYAFMEAQKDQDAEAAFRKYVELIPNEPNPHDSLAELLLRMGRFQESIESYQKALLLDAGFLSAYRGIAASLMYQEKHREAMEQLQKGLDAARNDGERQEMLRAMAVLEVDEGRLSPGLSMLSKESALAEKAGDKAAMAGVASARGELLLDAGKPEEAKTEFTKSLDLTQQSTLQEGRKKNVELAHHGALALVAAAKKDFEGAAKEADIMRAGFDSLGNPNLMRYAHQVQGIIALRRADYNEAISQLNQADISSPYTIFQLARAYAGKKDMDSAKTYYQKVAKAYPLPDLQYAMVRHAALKAVPR